MNPVRRPDLNEAFACIATMMLASIRARGWRGLKDLPAIWRFVMEFRRGGQALADLMADFLAGKLPPPAPVPEPVPWPDAPEWQATCAQPPAPPRPAARPEPAARARRQPT